MPKSWADWGMQISPKSEPLRSYRRGILLLIVLISLYEIVYTGQLVTFYSSSSVKSFPTVTF